MIELDEVRMRSRRSAEAIAARYHLDRALGAEIADRCLKDSYDQWERDRLIETLNSEGLIGEAEIDGATTRLAQIQQAGTEDLISWKDSLLIDRLPDEAMALASAFLVINREIGKIICLAEDGIL